MLLGLLLTLSAVGCETARNSRADVPSAAPDYMELARSHNDRVDMLSTLYSRGVLEVRWRDDQGVRKSEPQVDVDIYFMPMKRTAFRASKVGDIYLWLGSDDDRYWIFDLTDDERVLFHATHGWIADHGNNAASLHPLLIRDLMGLVRLPENGAAGHPRLHFDAQHDAWTVTVPATTRDWWIRLYFDRSTLLPKRADGRLRDGRTIFTSTIGRYRSAPQHGMAATRFPQMPTLIDIVAEDFTNDVSRLDIKIALGSPTGRVDDQPMDRVFDLDRLIQALRPNRIDSP